MACHCIVHHPQTAEEREKIQQMLAYARRLGDPVGMMVALAQLAGCDQEA
jgi:hypothetical protein